MGANIKGAGTDVIRIKGVKHLSGTTYSIIPDQIEAGTFMFAAAATKGDVTIRNVIPKHLESISAKLIEIGCEVTEYDDAVRVVGHPNLRSTNVKTLPYPGFPTDMQVQMLALLSVSEGTGVVVENVFENRFTHAGDLNRMGARILCSGRTAVVRGVPELYGARVTARDLRGGAALTLAGLKAQGETQVDGAELIDRGYEHLEDKLCSLGAEIRREKFE